MLNWLIDNKELLIIVLSILLGIGEVFGSLIGFIILLIVKKKDPVVMEKIYGILPGLICDAEKIFDDGLKKKEYVFEGVKNYLLQLFPKLNIRFYTRIILNAIEDILATPQKKEV